MSEEPQFTQRLCATIKQYWKAKGVRVSVRAEAASFRQQANQKSKTIYVIKSEGIPVK